MIPRPASLCTLALCVLGLAQAAWAATPWVPGASYDSAVPSPDAYLGREFASLHCTVDEIMAYSRLLADLSDRVQLVEMGRSVEGDPLLLLLITAPANRDLLQRRSAALAQVIDPWRHDAKVRDKALQELLPLTWIACSIHGDEASGSDAGLMLAYHLAADRSAATEDMLQRSIVAIDPCQNPDGRRRFLAHIRSFRRQLPGPDELPEAVEHNQLWPGGRRNHYLFDLNRDWAFLTQPETRARVAEFLTLRPQVFADLHEMGRESSYFFPPPADPVNPHVPAELREWWDVFGRANARAFDARGFDYFVRESYDLFYPGYGDSWPTLQGAIGMTFEQATTRGLMLRGERGDTLRYRDAVEHHFTAALTTCRTAAENDRELMANFGRYFELAKQRSQRDAIREYVLPSEGQRFNAERLAAKLVAQGVEVLATTQSQRVTLEGYVDGKSKTLTLPVGSLRVRTSQPSYVLVRSLLDKDVKMDAHFLEQESTRKENGLSDRFYDITAWSQILAHGLSAYTSKRELTVPSRRWEAPSEAQIAADAPPGVYAYLFPYEDNAALSALCRLLWRGVRVGVASEKFEQAGRDYPRGTLVVKPSENRDIADLGPLVAEIARHCRATMEVSKTAWTDVGPSLGSEVLHSLRAPRIALVGGPGTDPASVGALRSVFELRYEVPYSEVLLESLDDRSLAKFDVLIVPELDGKLKVEQEPLDRWLRAGGTLVGIGSAVPELLDELLADLELELIDDLERIGPDSTATREDADAAKSAEERYIPPDRRPDRTPGAILHLQLNAEHPFTVGCGATLFAPVLSDRILRASKDRPGVADYDAQQAHVAGFMWPRMEKALKGMSYLVHERLGEGHVVLFAEDPAFRGAWEGLDRLLLHAVLFAPNLRP